MSIAANQYANKIYAEHPIALWPLDEQAYYLSLINDDARYFTNWTNPTPAVAWTANNSYVPPEPSPFDSKIFSSITKTDGTAGTVDIQSPDLFSILNVDQDNKQFSVNLFLYQNNTYINWFKIGYRYTNVTQQQVVSDQIPKPSSSGWVNINHTFTLPTTYSGSIKIFLQVNFSAAPDAGARTITMNGLSVGQGSDLTCYESLGSTAVDLPEELGLPSVKGVTLDQYGVLADKGYYIVKSGGLLARNDAMAMIYGTDNCTRVYPSGTNLPSIVFPGKGMLHEKGRNSDFTFEMWMKIDPKTPIAKKIVGPLDSDDGIYVKEGFISLVIDSNIASHYVSEWYRPMLVNVSFRETNAVLMINGEEVLSVTYDRKTVSLSNGRDWWGIFSYSSVDFFAVDCIAIYPYTIAGTVAKRRFVYGQGTPNIQALDAAYSGTPTTIDFSTSQYGASVIYPDTYRWDAGYFNNLDATRNYISVPDYTLPVINLGGRDVSEWYNDNLTVNRSEYPDGTHPNFISFRPNQVTRTNLITNPSAETGTTNIAARGTGTTIARITTDYNFGTASIEVTKGAVASAGVGYQSGSRMAVQELVSYATSAYVKVPTGNEAAGIRLRVVPFNSAGTQLTVQNSTSTSITSALGWTRLSFVATMPATAVTAYVIVEQATAGTAGQKFLVDNVLFEQSSTVLPYFDGAYASASAKAISYGWSGTAHASTSTLSYWNPDGINYQDNSYFNFPTLNILNDQVAAVYGVFQADQDIASNRTLFSFANTINGATFDIILNSDEITYYINDEALYTEVITIGKEFLVGLNFTDAGYRYGYEVSNFFSSPSSIQVYVGGNGLNTFEGKLYLVGFSNNSNYDKISTNFYTINEVEYLVSNKALTSNVATLTTTATHKIEVGDTIRVSLDDNRFDGTYIVSAVTTNTFSYSKTAANVASSAVSPQGTATIVPIGGAFTIASNYELLLDHLASYTLLPEYEYGKLFLDISVDSEWEEFFPLSLFASYVRDENGNQVYDLDMMQINIGYVTVETRGIWTYQDLKSEFPSPSNNYSSVKNSTYKTSYFSLKKKNTLGNTINVSNSSLKGYITFQSIASGANAPLSSFPYSKPLDETHTIYADDENTVLLPEKAYQTKFSFIDDMIVFPPKDKPFEDYAMVVHLQIGQRSILKNPLKIRKLEITSKNFNATPVIDVDQRTFIGTKFGKSIYPYVQQINFWNGKGFKPYSISKETTPYLYTAAKSGIGVRNAASQTNVPVSDTQILLPINESGSSNFTVSAIQFMVKPEFDNTSDTIKLLEVKHKLGTTTYSMVKDGSSIATVSSFEPSGTGYALDGGSPSTATFEDEFNGGIPLSTYVNQMNIDTGATTISLVPVTYTATTGSTYFQNGRYVPNPRLINNEWTTVGIVPEIGFDFGDYKDGYITLFGGARFNNISYYLSEGLGIQTELKTRSWQEVLDANGVGVTQWLYWVNGTWQSVYVLQQLSSYVITPAEIYDVYVGTNGTILDDGFGLQMNEGQLKVLSDASWSLISGKPA